MARDISSLTGIRAIAVLGVLLCHYAHVATALFELPALADRLLTLGAYGVSLFFILSGFIISHTYAQTSWSVQTYRSFLFKRFARMYPLYVVMLVATVILYETARPYGFKPPEFDPSLFLQHIFMVQAWFNYTWGMWNQASWSISAEWFAYLGFPVVVFGLRRIKSSLMALIAGYAVLLTFTVYVQARNIDVAMVHGSALPNILANFIAGCCVYESWRRFSWESDSRMSRRLTLIGLALTVSLAVLTLALNLVGYWVALGFPLLIAGLAGRPKMSLTSLLERPFMQTLGKASFAIYITHGTVQMVTLKLAAPELVQSTFWPIQLLYLAGHLAIVVVVGVFAHYAIEHPARQLLVQKYGLRISGPDRVV